MIEPTTGKFLKSRKKKKKKICLHKQRLIEIFPHFCKYSHYPMIVVIFSTYNKFANGTTNMVQGLYKKNMSLNIWNRLSHFFLTVQFLHCVINIAIIDSGQVPVV